jgi:hypothetical protein
MNATTLIDSFDAAAAGPCTNGRRWFDHFKNNAAADARIDWGLEPGLSLEIHPRIIRSIQSWQLGESSDGSHLMKATDDFLATRAADPLYREAMLLFIREEQKHGNNLGRYLDLIGAERLKFDVGDWLFRKVRHLIGRIEIWTCTVFMIEGMAEIYYKALADSGVCPLLRDICDDILRDETWHILFQIERLRIQDREMPFIGYVFYRAFSFVLFLNIIGSVWLLHRRVFQAGGLTFRSYLGKAWRKFRRW